MKRFKRFSSWISLFLLGVALIVVYKTFDNLNGIWSFVGTILGILSPFVVGFVLAFLLYGPSHRLELLLQKASLSFVSKHSRALSVENSILFRGVKVGKGSVVKNSIIMQDTVIGENVNLNCVVTDKNVVIRDRRMLSGCEIQPYFLPKGSMV